MRRHLPIAAALATFTVGFLVAGAPGRLTLALPAALVLFALLSAVLRLRSSDCDAHALKVVVITLLLWAPVVLFYTMLIAPRGGFGSCELVVEEYPREAKAEESAPAPQTMMPVGDGREDAFRLCGAAPPDFTDGHLIWGGEIDDKALKKPRASYPHDLRTAEVTGTVAVVVVVDVSGSVVSATPVSGPPPLRLLAADAACSARFPPAHVGGGPFWVSGLISYDFGLRPGVRTSATRASKGRSAAAP
ncbi:MAG TPA: energy transducer TonB [Pyrinomonadaceae bacterium]|nr:energy transducer TonB [Pyrinomonadaceae bacterium]